MNARPYRGQRMRMRMRSRLYKLEGFSEAEIHADHPGPAEQEQEIGPHGLITFAPSHE